MRDLMLKNADLNRQPNVVYNCRDFFGEIQRENKLFVLIMFIYICYCGVCDLW